MTDVQHRRAGRAAHAAVLAVVVFALSLVAVGMRPSGSDTAVWWPAAGFAVAWVVRRGRPGVLALLAVGAGAGAANLAAGRPAAFALLAGLANAAEIGVAAGFVARRGPFRLSDVGDLGRLVVGAVLGGLACGVVAGLGVVLVLDGPFLATLESVAVTHAAAVLLLAPVALVGRDVARGPRTPARSAELVAQWAVIAAVTAVVFWPGQALPLTFLPLPVLVWTAVRSGVRPTAAQLVLVGVVATVAAVEGVGPFAGVASNPQVVVGLVQLYVLATGATVLVLALDVRQRGVLVARVSEREKLYRSGFDEALVGMLLARFDGHLLRVVEVNAVGAELLGAERDDLVGTPWGRTVLPQDLPQFTAGVLRVLDGDAPGWRGEVRIRRGEQVRWLEVALAPSGTIGDDPVVSVQMLDVTRRREDREHLAELALHDSLTGLPNRVLLLDRLQHALAGALRTGGVVGLVYLDLDGFKAVNDSAGHEAGDRVLVRVAEALRRTVRPGDTVARLGGDEFAVVCPAVRDEDALREVASRVTDAITGPVEVGGRSFHVGASAGVAAGPASLSAAELLRRADTAMYAEKGRRRGVPVG